MNRPDSNPYLAPSEIHRSSWTPTSATLIAVSVLSGVIVGIVVVPVMLFGVYFTVGMKIAPDMMSAILTSLMLVNVLGGMALGGFVAWLRVSQRLRITFGATIHIVVIALAVTVIACSLFCRPNAAQVVDGRRLEWCLLWSTGVIYLMGAGLTLTRCRARQQAGKLDATSAESSGGRE